MSGNDRMSGPGPESRWEVSVAPPAEIISTSDLVLAWARDSATGGPRYVCELGADRNGKRSGCECYSCGRPLLAINNTKREFRPGEKRPHFRHPGGTAKESCLLLTARAAALQALLSQGYLELPCRRRSFEVIGLSGSFHEAWVEHPSERVGFRHFEVHDHTRALLTLDDGRVLEVVLTGSMEVQKGAGDDAGLVSSILLVVDDPHVAAMSPDELRSRLDLVIENGVWCRHWDDEALRQQAEQAAQDKARAGLDFLGADFDFPEGTEPDEKRETLLHLLAKEILERERRLVVPELVVAESASLPNGKLLSRERLFPREEAALARVELERSIGRVRPDVRALMLEARHWPAGPLLVEVTVTNQISGERLDRIRALGLPAIEIDVSRMGGRATAEEFARLVVDEVAAKRWLHHSRIQVEQALLREAIALEIEAARELEQVRLETARRLEEARGANLEECCHRFLVRAEQYYVESHRMAVPAGDVEAFEGARLALRESAEVLAGHYGFPQARDVLASADFGKMLERVLSIWCNRRFCYPEKTVGQLLSDIRSEQVPNRQWHTIYLAAVRVYKPTLTEKQTEMVDAWRDKVAASLKAGETSYIRDRKYDRLLSALFPEMADLLSRPLPCYQAAPTPGPGPGVVDQPQSPLPRQQRRIPGGGGWCDGSVLSTANRDQWESCGVRNWRLLLEMGEECRSSGLSVRAALQQCSRRARLSEELIFGVWVSARLATSASE